MKRILLAFFCILSLNLGAQTWIQLGAPPTNYIARNHPVTFSIGDVAYIGTGYALPVGANPGALFADFYKYDPSNDSWTAQATFPGGARGFAYGVANGGKGYVGFGLNSSNTRLNDLWEFDPVSNSWTQLATCPGPGRRHPAMVATPGKIYVGCGDGISGNLNDWWEYDIASNTWAQKANFPSVVRHHPYHFTINGEAYVGCGHGASIYKDMYRYNAASDTWTAIATLPAQGRVAGTQFGHNGKGYLLSGQGEDHLNLATGEFWEYDPITNAWTALPPHPGTGRWAPGSFVIGSTVYLTAGSGFGAAQLDISDIWKYDLPFPVSVNDVVKNDIQIYPNPAKDKLNVLTSTKMDQIGVFSIYGSKLNVEIEKSGLNQVVINTSNLSAGTYLIKVISNEGVSSTQFVK